MPGGNSTNNRTLKFNPRVVKRVTRGNNKENTDMFILRPHNQGYPETRGTKFTRRLPFGSLARNKMPVVNETNRNNRTNSHRNYSIAYNNKQAKLAANALHEELLQNEPVITINPLRTNKVTLRKIDTLPEKIEHLKEHIEKHKIRWNELIPAKKRILASSFGIKINEYINTNSTILGQNLNTKLSNGGGKTKKRKY